MLNNSYHRTKYMTGSGVALISCSIILTCRVHGIAGIFLFVQNAIFIHEVQLVSFHPQTAFL